MSAPCTMLARRPRAGSSRPYLSRMDSNEHRPSTWPSSAPSTSNGTASFSRATRATSCGSTYRNSASLSRNRRISHGHAIRSTAAFFRVTNRIYRSPSIAAGTLSAGMLLEMHRDVPGPELDHVAARIGHVGGATTAVAIAGVIVVQNLQPGRAQSIDRRLVGRSRQVHRVVDMHATPPATEPQ